MGRSRWSGLAEESGQLILVVFGGLPGRSFCPVVGLGAGTNDDGGAFGVSLFRLVGRSGGGKGVSGVPHIGQQE